MASKSFDKLGLVFLWGEPKPTVLFLTWWLQPLLAHHHGVFWFFGHLAWSCWRRSPGNGSQVKGAWPGKPSRSISLVASFVLLGIRRTLNFILVSGSFVFYHLASQRVRRIDTIQCSTFHNFVQYCELCRRWWIKREERNKNLMFNESVLLKEERRNWNRKHLWYVGKRSPAIY